MNQKGFAPILIVLILAFLVGGYLVYQNQAKPTPSPQPTPSTSSGQATQPSPTPDASPAPNSAGETANWKTYKYSNFSVRLSDRWIPTEPWKKGAGEKVTLIEGITFKAEGDPYEISFQITDDPYPLGEVRSNTLRIENIILDGQPAVKFLTIAGQGADIYQPNIQSNFNDKRFNIWISTKSKEVQTDKEFDQILSTFKFFP